MSSNGGWAGQVLRVNLSTGDIKTEDIDLYKDYLGGMGIGYKVMWDEVPVGTKSYDEENKIIFGVGPLTGTGACMSSRVNITSLMPTHKDLIGDSHMGGHWAAELKYAGWDSIIIEGQASHPVWLRIENQKVTIEDARRLWGNGIYRATAEISGIMGEECQVAAIGQAGENLVNQAVIINSYSHSAGGHGGVMGSKNLKAIGVRGTLPVNIAGDKEEWEKLDQLALSLVGSNNNHVVPRHPQPWAEYSHPSSRWTATPGLYWGAAQPPVETGTCHPEDKQSIGLRCHKAWQDLGPVAEAYTVRMGGCQSCPIRCHGHVKIPQLEQYGYSPYAANTCMGWSAPGGVMFKGNWDKGAPGESSMIAKALGSQIANDYGVWCNYGQIGRDLRYAYDNGILEKVLPEEEYESIPFDLLEAGDPAFLLDFYKRIAFKIGEFSRLGEGSQSVSRAWKFGDDYYNDYGFNMWNPEIGFPKHHSSESAGQVGALINCMFNRDSQNHSLVNFTGSGLPIDVQKEIIAEVVGSPDAIDPPQDYTPMNEYKAKFAKWAIITNILHDSLTLCNWMWPLTVSPHKDLGYRGDLDLEAKYLSVATGENISSEDLHLIGERIFTLHRALTIKQMGTVDMRKEHDSNMADWIFEYPEDAEPFTPGNTKMDRDDMEKALSMFYKECGWDEKTGAPTKETLNRLGLSYVASELESLDLLP